MRQIASGCGESSRLTAARMTVGFRYSTLASRVAAGIIYMHPGLRLAAGIVMWTGIAKMFFNEETGQWEKDVSSDTSMCPPSPSPPGEGKSLIVVGPGGSYMSTWCNAFGTPPGAVPAGQCAYYAQLPPPPPLPPPAECYMCYAKCEAIGSAPVLTTPIETRVPVTREEFEDAMAGKPMPQTVPAELPDGSELPVDKVVINPGPGDDMTPHTMRIPTGDPVPTADPTKWRQPYVDVVPSPIADNPFRVDVRPGEKLVDSPDPMPDPVPDPTPSPTDTPKPPEQQDLCEKNPDILACQKVELGSLDAEHVNNEDKTITLTPDTGWGPSGACPAPRTVNLHGGLTLSIPLDLMCEFARMIRPLIVAAAYLGAAAMLVGAARKD